MHNDPDILILDESTNNLDIDVENKILNDLQKLKDTKTIIFITHRENPLIYCDEIYEIINGNAKKEVNIIIIMPARGGSKRLKNKNILPINKKPMFVYTMLQAMRSKKLKIFCFNRK